MKIKIEITCGRIIFKEVDYWLSWGDGIKGYDEDRNCILFVPAEHLVAFEVATEEEDDES